MKCVLVGLLIFGAVALVFADDDFKCVDGKNYKENDCNHCWCEKGEMACTLMACQTHEDPAYKNCEVGSKWKKDCNQCWCLKGTGVLCTADKC